MEWRREGGGIVSRGGRRESRRCQVHVVAFIRPFSGPTTLKLLVAVPTPLFLAILVEARRNGWFSPILSIRKKDLSRKKRLWTGHGCRERCIQSHQGFCLLLPLSGSGVDPKIVFLLIPWVGWLVWGKNRFLEDFFFFFKSKRSKRFEERNFRDGRFDAPFNFQ